MQPRQDTRISGRRASTRLQSALSSPPREGSTMVIETATATRPSRNRNRNPEHEQEIEAKMDESSRRPTSEPTGWLPHRRQPNFSSRALYPTRFIQKQKGHDWFAALAWAIDRDKRDANQSKLLSKLYIFLCDFFPEGLCGEYSHISGNDIMEQLLSHGESTASRHKIGKHADSAFSDLESWMGAHGNWQTALDHAKAETERLKVAGSKKKIPWRAPGMHSPAGMVAILVLANPDDAKFKRWIQRLEIEWMMQERDTLAVSQGFWKGITMENLYSVFAPAEPREAGCPLLADYDQLLGENFPRCRRDIRPYLQPWARNISLEEGPCDTDQDDRHSIASDDDAVDVDQGVDDGTGDSAESQDRQVGGTEETETNTIPGVSSAQVLEIGPCLTYSNLPGPADSTDLQEWLFAKLGTKNDKEQEDNQIIAAWCRYWEERIIGVRDVLRQVLVRELFTQSLRRLHALQSSSIPSLAHAYMVIDMADRDLRCPAQDTLAAAVRLLREFPEYVAFEHVTAQLIQACPSSVESRLVTRLSEAQTCFFQKVTLGPYFEHWKAIITIETVRIHGLLQHLKDLPQHRKEKSDLINPVTSEAVAVKISGTNGDILGSDAASVLQLSSSQLRAILLRADYGAVLTTCQRACAERVLVKGERIQPDEPQKSKPLPIVASSVAAGTVRDTLQGLQKLFNDLVVRDEAVANFLTSASSTPFIPKSPSVDGPRNLPATPARTPVSWPSQDLTSPTSPVIPFGRRNSAAPVQAPSTNAWTGKSFKRAASPDNRVPKVPKQDLRQELISARQQLREELRGDSAPLREEVESVRQELKAELDSVRQELQTELASVKLELKSLHDDMKVNVVQHLQSMASRRPASDQSIRAELDTVRADLTSTIERAQGDVDARVQNLLEVLNEVRKERTALGEDGFLAQNCPAPPGWNQADYSLRLERAAWFYINRLGNPDGGVGEDGFTLTVTQSKFPDLIEKDIITALQHFHTRTFHRPLGRQDGQQEEEGAGLDFL